MLAPVASPKDPCASCNCQDARWIFNPSISLDGRDFESLRELDRHDTLGEWGRSIQEAVYSRNFSLALLLDLVSQLVILSFTLFIERGNSFVEPSFFITRIHYVSIRGKVSGSFSSPRPISKLTSLGGPYALSISFIVRVGLSFSMPFSCLRSSFIRQLPL
jgi:hypothetical protein